MTIDCIQPARQPARNAADSFRNPDAIANYAEGPPRFVPGFEALHRMTAVLLAENAPATARVLVLGAGGGLELGALARAQPDWSFVGIDPSQPMLDLASGILGPLMQRIELVHGYIDDAPAGPFDAATCLLTLHFLDAAERLRTTRAIRSRLKPGSPFVAAHGSFPQDPASRPRWLSRYAAYAVGSGADPAQAASARAAVDAHLNLLDPVEDEGILRDAGFSDIAMFYAAFTWRGWVARA
jgi:tRNA (cmo5U34)-methyltransferase